MRVQFGRSFVIIIPGMIFYFHFEIETNGSGVLNRQDKAEFTQLFISV